MPTEAPRPFQFTLCKALLAFVILSLCMLALSEITQRPDLRLALELISIVTLLVTVLCGVAATMIVFSLVVMRHFRRNKLADSQLDSRNL